jgi:hypothetical protein
MLVPLLFIGYICPVSSSSVGERYNMAGANSTITLQDMEDYASSFGDLAPALATGGYSTQPAQSIGNDVMTAMLLGNGDGMPFNWKWNSLNIKPWFTISLQQDYFVPNVVNLGWLESSWAVNINQTSNPKQKLYQEVHRALEVTYDQTGYPGKICWMQNDQLQVGTWGQSMLLSPSGLQNPGPGVVYTNPSGAPQNPTNPCTGIADAYGNLWTVTTYGTCGTFDPFQAIVTATAVSTDVLTVTAQHSLAVGTQVMLQGTQESNVNGALLTILSVAGSAPNYTGFTAALAVADYSNASDTGNVQIVPAYPVYQAGNPSVSATLPTLVQDGSVIWTAINPKGQGFRLNPIPPNTGVVWLVNPVAQMRVPRFTNMQQTLEPIPDDWETYFKQGFSAQCYRRSPDPKVRMKFKDEWELFMKSLDNAVKQGQREMNDFGFYPGNPSVMNTGWAVNPTRPDWPFGPWCG